MKTPVTVEPPTVTERPRARETGAAAAPYFLRRVRLLDRIARSVISVSGIGIIAAVLGIGLFLVLEILPLFRPAGVTREPLRSDAPSAPVLVIVDEHQQRAIVVGEEPVARLMALGEFYEEPEQLPLEGLEGERITAAARALGGETVALATAAGNVWLGSMSLRTVFDGAERSVSASVELDAVIAAAPGQAITALAHRRIGNRDLLATVIERGALIVTRAASQKPLVGPPRRSFESVPVPVGDLRRVTSVAINERGTELIAGTSHGRLVRWRIPSAGALERLESLEAVPGGEVRAMRFLLGDRSLAVGGSDGSLATWSLLRDETAADGWRLAPIHRFAAHPADVTLISPSPRDKGFITASSDGTARLHYMTSERLLAQWRIDPAAAADFAPKANGALFVGGDGQASHWRIANPHPEFSWRALFGKIWYEGYERPDYVWQSTGGTDDFEPKLSLAPLMFGTMKGTLYALLFAVPVALFGALYCSQFLDKKLRNTVKSTIELMAALPSVVLGFLAGVMLAPLVHERIVGALTAPVLVPLVALAGMAACRMIPWAPLQRAVIRREFIALTAWALIGLALALALGPGLERLFFDGDFAGWLVRSTGTRYDQRNALVVGWVMGFAVIPIIFTMCEDAFSAVPRHLVSASLACGASMWQTAWRIVLPAAGSGVFSGIMVGFGRAVGETMIVLMATGNTPVMDWSVFNGFRALSANVAVEIPEAPHGGTLYRVLFVSSLVLFVMTSVVNTAAELIRLRLRNRLKGL